jgi:hypothetical protein
MLITIHRITIQQIHYLVLVIQLIEGVFFIMVVHMFLRRQMVYIKVPHFNYGII